MFKEMHNSVGIAFFGALLVLTVLVSLLDYLA